MSGEAAIRFNVLGPLEISDDRGRVAIRAAKQQLLLAVLLCGANEPVSVERLIHLLWTDCPPRTAPENLRLYVYHLRRALGDPQRIVRVSSGYALTVHGDELDAHRFEQLTRRGEAALSDGDPWRAAATLSDGLALWRGRAYAGLDGIDLLRDEAVRLEERRRAALEARIDADLALGRHRALVAELSSLVAQHPLVEGLRCRLMLALYRCGRQAEALQVYRDTRRLLAEELGLEPGPELRRLEQAIITGDPSVAAPNQVTHAVDATPRSDVTVRPAQLQPDVRGFTGRADDLARLDAALPGVDAAAMRIAAIWGTAGVGKSALAIRWAHSAARHFPDGQLSVNLRGWDPAAAPMPPTEALLGFLSALGVRPEAVPPGLSAQIGLYRSLLADRRVLIVLDNARDADHVRPLLPGAPGCFVLVTSRADLAGLVVSDGAEPLVLDLLTEAEARGLLAARMGRERVDAESSAATALIALCDRLPLALALVAARAVSRPSLRLTDLVAQLREGTLEALAHADPTTDLRAVFSATYRALSVPAARLFRLFGLLTSPDVSLPALASLVDESAPRTKAHVAELTAAHLLTEDARGRFMTHDLLRAYAAELVHYTAEDVRDERPAALRRLLDHYAQVADAAVALVLPNRERTPPPSPTGGFVLVSFDGVSAALNWLVAESAAVHAAVMQAASSGHDGHAVALSLAVLPFADIARAEETSRMLAETAMAAARRNGDLRAQAQLYRELCAVAIQSGLFSEAETALEHGIEIWREIGDRYGEAMCFLSMSDLFARQGRYAEGLDRAERCLALVLASERTDCQVANAYNVVGWLHALVGNHEQAIAHSMRAKALAEAGGDEFLGAHILDTLGYAYNGLRQHDEAIRCYSEALETFRRLGDRPLEAIVLVGLGTAHQGAGEHYPARFALQSALRLMDELDHPDAGRVRAQLEDLRELRTSPG